MADENQAAAAAAQSQNGAGSNGAAPAAATNGAAPGAGERPGWLPERFKSPEEFAEAFSDIDKRAQRASNFEQQLRDWQQWGDPKTLNSRLNEYIARQIAEDRRSSRGQQQAAQDQIDWDAIQDFTGLSPKKYREVLLRDAILAANQVIDQRWQTAQQQIAQIQADWDQRQKIQNAVTSAKLSSPELQGIPDAEIYQTMLNIASGDQNSLMALALSQLTSGKRQEDQQKAIEARVKADMELAARNKSQEALSGVLKRYEGNKERPKGKEAIKAKLLKDALTNGLIRPENI